MEESTQSPAEKFMPNPEDMARALRILTALANEQRLQILCLLAQKEEMTVGELNEQLILSQSALSQHLKKLRDQGFLASRKEGLNVFYRIGKEDVLQILDLLHGLYCKPE